MQLMFLRFALKSVFNCFVFLNSISVKEQSIIKAGLFKIFYDLNKKSIVFRRKDFEKFMMKIFAMQLNQFVEVIALLKTIKMPAEWKACLAQMICFITKYSKMEYHWEADILALFVQKMSTPIIWLVFSRMNIEVTQIRLLTFGKNKKNRPKQNFSWKHLLHSAAANLHL